jgi:ArsR family transcriptional regulator
MAKSSSATSPQSEAAQEEALRRFKAGVFQVLAHPTRIHIIECLSEGELPVSSLLARIGVEPANLSQHLTVLRSKQLVLSRKEGNQVFYQLRDMMVIEMLSSMKRYFMSHLEDSLSMLRALEDSKQTNL